MRSDGLSLCLHPCDHGPDSGAERPRAQNRHPWATAPPSSCKHVPAQLSLRPRARVPRTSRRRVCSSWPAGQGCRGTSPPSPPGRTAAPPRRPALCPEALSSRACGWGRSHAHAASRCLPANTGHLQRSPDFQTTHSSRSPTPRPPHSQATVPSPLPRPLPGEDPAPRHPPASHKKWACMISGDLPCAIRLGTPSRARACKRAGQTLLCGPGSPFNCL